MLSLGQSYNIAHDKRLNPQGCFHLPDFPMILAPEAFSKTVNESSHSSLSCYHYTKAAREKQLPVCFFPFPQLPEVTAALKFPLFALYLRNILLKLCFTSAESPCLSVCMPFHIFYTSEAHTPTPSVFKFLTLKGEPLQSFVTSSLWDTCPYMAQRLWPVLVLATVTRTVSHNPHCHYVLFPCR